MTAWHDENPDLWRRERDTAASYLADCVASVDGAGIASIRGTFPLRLESGHELDRFAIRIEYPSTFPKLQAHPTVFLESHRDVWFRTNDGHAHPNWGLCLFVPLESGLDFNNPTALEGLFAHLHSYLIRQRLFQARLRASQLQLSFAVPHVYSVLGGSMCLRTAVLAASRSSDLAPSRFTLVESRRVDLNTMVLPPSQEAPYELRGPPDPGLSPMKPRWPGPQRSHGTKGLVEAIVDRGGLLPDEPCVCGSGRTYQDCHLHETRTGVAAAVRATRQGEP